MEFVKKHYEKLVLSLVLLGLAVAVGLLPYKIKETREYLDSKRQQIQANPKSYVSLNLGIYSIALERLKNRPTIVLSGAHNTFNPVLWQVRPDGTRLKVVTGKEVGPQALSVSAITPLNTVVNLERISGQSYLIGILREASTNKIERTKKATRYVSKGSPTVSGFFKLVEVKGAPENPDEIVLELADTQERAGLAKDKPFKRVDGYAADLAYEPESKKFTGVRKDDTIGFGGDQYNVMDIKPDEIVLLSKSSQRVITVKAGATP